MKKKLMVLAVTLTLVSGATAAFAAAPQAEKGVDTATIHQQMLDQRVKDGVLTEEQAKQMKEQMANGNCPMMNGMMGGMMNGMMGMGAGMGNASMPMGQNNSGTPATCPGIANSGQAGK